MTLRVMSSLPVLNDGDWLLLSKSPVLVNDGEVHWQASYTGFLNRIEVTMGISGCSYQRLVVAVGGVIPMIHPGVWAYWDLHHLGSQLSWSRTA